VKTASDADGINDKPWVPPELADPDGLAGVGGDLSPRTLLRAYADGLFPWFSEGEPILWWSPDPRGILELGALCINSRLARTIRSGRFQITFNTAFEPVMRACGENRPEGTWVNRMMIDGYTRLHRLQHAHSVEAWRHGELVGGVYGVSLGGLFSAESMFHREADASKVALAALMERVQLKGFELIDVQMTTAHTTRMGAIEIPRTQYLKRLRKAVQRSDVRF
jgi:leucyl/phenylalanyl-tRNA--protein transferase